MFSGATVFTHLDGMCDQQSLRSACAYAQSDQSLWEWLEYSTTVKLLSEHHLEFLSLTGGWTGLYESTLVKIPNCWKSHVTAHILYFQCMKYPFSMRDPTDMRSKNLCMRTIILTSQMTVVTQTVIVTYIPTVTIGITMELG